MQRKLTEALGWYGVAAILFAYVATNFGFLSVDSPVYLFLNLTGAAGVVIDAWRQKNYQPVVLNTVWGVVAFIALARFVI